MLFISSGDEAKKKADISLHLPEEGHGEDIKQYARLCQVTGYSPFDEATNYPWTVKVSHKVFIIDDKVSDLTISSLLLFSIEGLFL